MMNPEREPMVERSYHIRLELFKKAFIAFQKRFVYPRNWLLTAVLGAVALVYLDSVTQNPSNYLAMALLVVCAAMIAILWFNPRKIRKNLFDSLQELENDTYHVCFYENSMTISTEDMPPLPAAKEQKAVSTLADDIYAAENPQEEEASVENPVESEESNGFRPLFEGEEAAAPQSDKIEPTVIQFHKNVKVIEYSEYFMVYLVKQMFYVVPKEAFNEDELIRLRCIFTDSLGERFHPMKQ